MTSDPTDPSEQSPPIEQPAPIEASAPIEPSETTDTDNSTSTGTTAVPRRGLTEVLARHRWTALSIAAFAVVRTLVIAVSATPFRVADSSMFTEGAISLSGDAEQFWPVPLFMRLGGSDTGRMWLQHGLAVVAWGALATGLAHIVRTPWLRHAAVAAALVMGLAPQVVNWDPVVLGESVVTSLAVLTVALWLWRDLGAPAVGAATGLVALLLVGARPTTLPLVAVVVAGGAVALVRSGSARARVAAGAVVLLGIAGSVWMVSTLDAHDEAYRRHDDRGISFGGELAAGQLWDRMLADDDTFVWLTERGMPDPVDGIRPAPAGVSDAERAATWSAFLDAAVADPDWNQWLDEQGSSLAVEWAAAQPVAALSGWADHSGEVLAGSSSAAGGPAAVRGVLADAQPFFRGAGWTSDVALLFAASALLVLFARRARENGEVHRADDGAAVAAAGFVTAAAGWLFTGIEVERHAVPGPVLLRLGLLLMVVTLVDSMAPRPDGRPVRRW